MPFVVAVGVFFIVVPIRLFVCALQTDRTLYYKVYFPRKHIYDVWTGRYWLGFRNANTIPCTATTSYHHQTKPTSRACWTWVCIKSHGNGLVIALVLGAQRAEVAAPPGIEVCNALALCRIVARLFTLLNIRQFSRRVLDIFLSGARVAFDIGADLYPCASVLMNVCKRRIKQNICVNIMWSVRDRRTIRVVRRE